MNNDFNNTDLFDKYLRKELTDSEINDFENLLNENAELQKDFIEHKSFLENLKRYDELHQLKLKINNYQEEIERENWVISTSYLDKKRRFRVLLSNMAVAASVALVTVMSFVGIYGWLNYKHNIATYNELKKDISSISNEQKSIWREVFGSKKEVAFKYSGTCFSITSDGYLVTSYHLIKNSDSVIISNEIDSLVSYKAQVVYRDQMTDIAILKIDDAKFESFGKLPYTVNNGLTDIGEEVYTLGFSKNDIVFGEGSISSISGFNGDSIAYEVSVPANPGNSGAPLLDGKGNLIGIISGKHSENQSSTFAIKSKYLVSFIDSIMKQDETTVIELPRTTKMKKLSRAEQLKIVQPFIFKVEAF